MLPGKKYTPIDLLAIAWRRRWLLVLPMLLGGYAGLIVSSQLTDQYQSEMLIQVVPQRVPDAYVQSTVTLKTEDRLNALSQQVRSRTELEPLILDLDLYRDERARMPMQDVVDLMNRKIAVQVVRTEERGAEAFYLRFTYHDPRIATLVTERLGALFIDLNSRDRGNLADATNSFLETQLQQARERLEEHERKLEQFRERHAGRLPTQVEFNMQAIQAAQMQLQAHLESLARQRDRKLVQEQLLAAASAEPPVPSVQLPATPQNDPTAAGTGTADQQLAAARDTLARLELRLKPQHPDIIRAKRLIQDLEARVETEGSGQTGSPAAALPPPQTQQEQNQRARLRQMQAEIESLDRQIRFKEGEERRMRATIAEYQSRIEQTPGVESEWLVLTRDYETQQEAYKGLLGKSEQSKVAAELEKRQIGEQFRVLDPARSPQLTGIPRVQINAIGVAAGLLLGLLAAAFIEFRDTTFRRPEEVADVFRLPVIALVPLLTSDGDRRRMRRNRVVLSFVSIAVVAVGSYGVWVLQLWKHIR